MFWIIIGGGIYGITVGLWRDPSQAVYVAVKFPLLILLTTFGNAFLNGILAPVLGAKISFRQSCLAILISFAVATIILGSLAPLSLLLVYNAPTIESTDAELAHNGILISHVTAIAFAGIVANLRLFDLLLFITKSSRQAKTILFSWLAGNLLLGGQLSWILRPFIGSPTGAVEFLREKAFDGNFFEAVFLALRLLFK